MSSGNTIARELALTEAVEDQRVRVLHVIRKMIGDQTEAEDVLQDVFAEFIEVYDLGETVETVGAWLMRVARNKVLDRFRRRKTQDDYRFLVEASENFEAVEPGNEWMREWLQTEIIRALEKLPNDQRSVFVEHELEGKSFEEISAASGVSVNTLLSRKRYAILTLRKHLKEIYDEL